MIQEKVTGWDFSVLGNRMTETPLPWDYLKIIDSYIRPGCKLLDLGTGGGELLSHFAGRNIQIYATEAFEPNVKIAEKKLSEIGGVLISDFTDDNLPFDDNFFDLIIDRHESYNSGELYRILKPGGHFITQQVDGKSELTVNEILNLKTPQTYLHWNLNFALKELVSSGFKIVMSSTDKGFTRYSDADAVMFYIKSAPWQFKDFSDIDFNLVILNLKKFFSENEFMDVIKIRFLIVAQK